LQPKTEDLLKNIEKLFRNSRLLPVADLHMLDTRNRHRVSMSWSMLDALLVIERDLRAVSRRGKLR
jgi:hypothetical protein